MADDIVVNVDFRGSGPQFLAELSRAVGRAKDQLREMGQSGAQLSRLETQLARLSATAKDNAAAADKAAQATQGWSQKYTPFKGQFQAAEAASKDLWKSIDTGIASAEGSLKRATKAVDEFDESQRRAAQDRAKGTAMSDWDKEFSALNKTVAESDAKLKAAKQASEDFKNSLSNSRYVLYDVAGTLATIGAAFLVPITGALGIAINFEKEFAQVARTSGATGDELRDLKVEFDNLYASIPITYGALAEIATLAGQLGIPASQVGAFADAVAKTAAVTDLSVEQAATAFGRLNALIPNVQGQYDKLGSAIAKVGVNSVATESEIVNISTQISSMGSFAGLTAQDIVGLSGALASIGAQPELSRGTVTRVFSLMSKAVAEGGESLDKFAQISGVSSDKFSSTWGTPRFTETFLGFMRGIQSQGGNAVAVLNDLGITSVRDVPLLLRLANAADSTGQAGALLAQTIKDSNTGWSENIELQRQYEIISATVASKLQVLGNNFNLLLQAIGAPLLGAMGEFIGFLTEMVQNATDFAQTDFGGNVLRAAVVIGAIIGVLALAAGGMALFGAASIGVGQAMLVIRTVAPGVIGGITGMGTSAATASGGMLAANGASRLLAGGLTLLRLGIAGVVLGGLFLGMQSLSDSFADAAFQAKGFGQSTDETFERVRANAKATADAFVDNSTAWLGGGVRDFGVAVNRQTAGLDPSSTERRDVANLDEQLSALARGGGAEEARSKINELRTAFDQAGVSSSDFNTLFRDTIGALGEGAVAAGVAGDETSTLGAIEEQVAAQTEKLAASLGLSEEALKGFIEGFASGSATFFDFSKMLGEAYGEDGGGLGQFTEALRNQLVDVQVWQEGVANLLARGATAAATEFSKLGPSSAQAVKDAQALSQPELEALNADIAKVGTLSSEEFATNFINNAPLLQDAYRVGGDAAVKSLYDALMKGPDATREVLNELIRVANEKKIKIGAISDFRQAEIDLESLTRTRFATIRATTVYEKSGEVAAYAGRANGGSVWGPGTATSDSILTRLSNGEFVIRTAAAKAIGYGRLDYLNQTGKLPTFATGGQVGGSTPRNTSGGGTTVVELSAYDRSLLARAGDVRLSIDGKDVAAATNGANFVSSKRGSN